MRVFINVVDAIGVEQRSAPLDAVHFVTLRQQEFGEIGPSCPVTPVMRAFFILFCSLNPTNRIDRNVSLRFGSSGNLDTRFEVFQAELQSGLEIDLGSQPNSLRALLMSGCRWIGSSCGRGQ